MQIKISNSENNTTISVAGRIDTSNYNELQAEVDKLDFSSGNIIFDFSSLQYISSSGLRVLLSARKKATNDNMKIINVSDDVFEIFETTGFDSLIKLERAKKTESYDIHLSFKEALSEIVKKIPDKTFITHLGKSYTWKEIEMYSQIIAADLSNMGVKKGTHVGLCSSNSANWIFTFFAIQKLGAVACLLNFNYSEAEIKSVSMIGDITHLCYGEIATVQDENTFITAIKNQPDSKITEVYSIRDDIDFSKRTSGYAEIANAFPEKIEADDVCVMIYTSGSTGKPKGVLLSAFNILNAALARATAIELAPSDKLCLILPLFHIFGLTAGFFSNALLGGQIIIPDSIKTDTLLDTIETEKCTLFHSVPTMALAIMNNKNFSSERIATLRCTILSGAATTEAQMRELMKNFPNVHFMSSYGLSEMSPVSITDYNDSVEHICTSVGKPVADIKLKIQNMETKEDCPIGVSGEILVEGFNLMCAYYKAALTSQAVDEKGWLHTGDLGFLDSEGYLHITGRAKELIIRGGENIMPNEIASAISQNEKVKDVKVLGVPDDFYGEVVCACVAMKDSCEFDEDAMRTFLADKLAKYKIPAYFLVYDELPKLANGKVDAVNLKKEAEEKCKNLKK